MSLGSAAIRWRRALRSLSGSPGSDWRSLLVHHGVRAGFVVGAAVLLPFLFPRTSLPSFAHLEEGMVAPEDVIARVPFQVMKDPSELAVEREEAASSVAPILTLDPAAADSAATDAIRLFTQVDSAARTPGADTSSIRGVLAQAGVTPTPEQLQYLASSGRRSRLRDALVSAYRTLLPRGVVSRGELGDVSAGQVVVRSQKGDRLVARDSLLTTGGFYERAAARESEELGPTGQQLFQTLLVRYVQPTLRLDNAATRAARQQNRDAVRAVEGSVLQGERIVAAHERVSRDQVRKLRAYEAELRRQGQVTGGYTPLRTAGSVLYGVLILGLLAAVLLSLRPRIYRDLRGFVLVVGLAFTVVVAGGYAASAAMPAVAVPVAFAALVVGALYDGLLGVIVAAVVAALAAGQPPLAGSTTPFLTFVAGAAAAMGVRGVRRRSDSWILLAVVTAAYVVGASSLALTRSLPLHSLLVTAGWGGLNAALSTVVAMGLAVPALESFTGIITDQTLLELSDLDRPLLRRLSREAPGTYAHSIGAANLAEAACSAIGANALLARVGVYYHDIGKMARPQFFIENQPPGRNPHDRLPPEKSVEVLREHVREGLRLAEEARLPGAIRDFIAQHHGSQRISFFFEKARQQGRDPDPEAYRYEGPRPRGKETTVVMLADAVESATRTLSDPTPSGIRTLIERLTRGRLEEGQFDESPITLGELVQVKEEFARVLIGMYHRRIDYPGSDTAPPAAEEAGPKEAGDAEQPEEAGEPVRAAEARRPGETAKPGPDGDRPAERPPHVGT
ncbi:MAG: HDIG domain-containing protein [Candidatus Palauibacterales bacterium]|nr:HDIG domain-containing protein [Candidatus Palauibacterales bacterium]MDP2529500.1 HDIG domain-containing protein [Candidatus Palauibacterales bacterium]MDP2585152.1 HDIG domain-containing protein [Candidatus Palauibacterales bacterium]